MEQHHTQEHIATLCAAGTLAVAATGFALVHEDIGSHETRDGKKHWSTAHATTSPEQIRPNLVAADARSHSIIAPSTLTDKPGTPLSTAVFRTRRWRDARPVTANESNASDSRGSSMNRSDILRPRTADTRSTSERRDASAGSSWLKRISTISSSAGSSPAVSIRHKHDPLAVHSLRPQTSQNMGPNKLVKRSTSEQKDNQESVKGFNLRRPATSHQRSAMAYQHGTSLDNETGVANIDSENPTSQESNWQPTWRPFFARDHPRKRYSMSDAADISNLPVTPNKPRGRATLVLGSSIERSTSTQTQYSKPHGPSAFVGALSNGRHRLRRSLSSIPRVSRRRYFTDPAIRTPDDTSLLKAASAADRSPISPISNMSAFEVDLPTNSPTLNSSPPVMPNRHRFSFRKRDSAVPSDPTTLSSDNETRIFTDDDSLEFHSDTAFDSLATRATSVSHQTPKTRKLETVFNGAASGPHSDSVPNDESGRGDAACIDDERSGHDSSASGFRDSDINGVAPHDGQNLLTPVKVLSSQDVDPFNTPVPPGLSGGKKVVLADDIDDIDWSPKSDSGKTSVRNENSVEIANSPDFGPSFVLTMQRQMDPLNVSPSSNSKKRLSIFDWSENQRIPEPGKRLDNRPKTVHGKQAYDNIRSRSSGRKAPNQLHLRSQSVPGNRDAQAEPSYPATSKYGTWGLGHKPVSEEWGDDFEFDDVDEESELPTSPEIDTLEPQSRGSLKTVKVPQSIIDRQASVHIQFGQVRDFMMLVEELKRLRTQGAALDILEGTSKQLWEDAESIINLATINDDEEDNELRAVQLKSSLITETFGEESPYGSRQKESPNSNYELTHQGSAGQLVSMPATPPSTGRPRGESLAQAKTFLQTIHQNRGGPDSSPVYTNVQTTQKLPFDTQDLKELVITSGAITRALKEVVRKAEGVSVSPQKSATPKDPPFSQIFRAPDTSPCPPIRRSGLPKSNSAHGYLNGRADNSSDVAASRTVAAIV